MIAIAVIIVEKAADILVVFGPILFDRFSVKIEVEFLVSFWTLFEFLQIIFLELFHLLKWLGILFVFLILFGLRFLLLVFLYLQRKDIIQAAVIRGVKNEVIFLILIGS